MSENFQFLEIKFSIYLNRRVFVMIYLLDFLPFVLALWLRVFFPVRYATMCYIKRKVLAPKGSKFFPFKVNHFSEGRQNQWTELSASCECIRTIKDNMIWYDDMKIAKNQDQAKCIRTIQLKINLGTAFPTRLYVRLAKTQIGGRLLILDLSQSG